jgi:MbtH protein
LPKTKVPYLKYIFMSNTADDDEDITMYKVVVNHEGQYSLWPANRENALGWKDAGKQGTKDDCLAYIKQVWTGARPSDTRHKGL